MARNPHRPPNPGGYRPRPPTGTPVPPPGDREVGRLVSRRKLPYEQGEMNIPPRPFIPQGPPPGMHICPITGKWRHNPPPRISSAALKRSVWGCVIVILGMATYGFTGAEWAFLTVAAGCFLMSRTVVVEVLHWSRDSLIDAARKYVEAERHHQAIRTIRDGVYRGPAESRPPPPPPSSEPSEVIRTIPPKIHPGQMIDPRPEGSMMLPPVVVLGSDVPIPDDVVDAMKAINEGGDLFEVWIVSKTKLSFDEWMDATIPEIEG